MANPDFGGYAGPMLPDLSQAPSWVKVLASMNPVATPAAQQLGLGAGPGDILPAVQSALAAPGAAVRTAVGLGNQDQGLERIKAVMHAAVPVSQLAPEGLQNFAAETASDPLSYLGFGLPGKLAGMAAQGSRTAKILGALQEMDSGATAAMQAGIAAPFQAIKAVGNLPITKPLVRGRQVLEPNAEGVMTFGRDATSLTDLWGSYSKQAALKMFGRQLNDAIGYLKARGHNLNTDVADMSRALPQVPDDPQAMHSALTGLEGTFHDAIQNNTDPMVRMMGMELYRQKELGMQKLAADAVAERAANGGQLPPDAAMRYFKDAAAMLQGATDTLIGFGRSGAKAPFSGKTGSNILASTDAALGDIGGMLGDYHRMLQDPNFAGTPDDILKMLSARVDQNGQSIDKALAESMAMAHLDNGNPLMSHATSNPGDPWFLQGNQYDQQAIDAVLSAWQQGKMKPPVDLNSVAPQLENRTASIKATDAGTPGLLLDLPSELVGPMAYALPSFKNIYKQIEGGRKGLEQGMNLLMNKMRPDAPYQEFVPTATSGPADWLQHMNTNLQSVGLKPVTSTVELLDRFAGVIPPERLKSLQTLVQKFPGGDLLQTDPYELALDRVIRAHGSSVLKLDDRRAGRVVRDLTSGFKELSLLSPNQLIQNVMGGLFNGALEGVNPVQVMGNLKANSAKALRGEPVIPEETQKLTTILGVEVPTSVYKPNSFSDLETDAARATQHATGKGESVLQRVGAVKLGVGGAAVGGYSGATAGPSDATPQERAVGTVVGATTGGLLGASAPTVSKYLLNRLGAGAEEVMRSTAYTVKLSDAASARLPELQQIARKTGINIDRQITALDGMLSPERLQQMLQSAGAHPPDARQAAAQWRDVLQTANREAEDFANKIHFDYEKLTNLEQFARDWFPFSTWTMKAIPFFGKAMAEHPLIASTVMRISQESENQKQEAGLTNRVTGAVKSGAADMMWGILLGRPVSAWMNPMRQLMPFSDVTRDVNSLGREDMSLPEKIYQGMNTVLPTPHPLVDLLLRGSGLLGADAPARGYVRQAGPLQGVTALAGVNRGTGVDLNKPFIDAESTLRRGAGQDPTNIQQTLILKRLDEMALRDTGKPISSGAVESAPYLQAKTAQKGPVWDAAAQEVARERGTQSAVGFVAGVASPQAIVTPEEEAIRGARKEQLLTPALSQTIRDAARKNPQQTMSPEVIAQIRAVSAELSQVLWDKGELPQGELPPMVEKRLANPTAANLDWVRTMIETEQTNRNPLMRGYSGSGSPKEQKLQNLMAQYRSIPAQLPGLNNDTVSSLNTLQGSQFAELRRRSGSNNLDMQMLNKLSQSKDAFKTANPILDEYLAYLQSNGGGGDIKTFLAR